MYETVCLKSQEFPAQSYNYTILYRQTISVYHVIDKKSTYILKFIKLIIMDLKILNYTEFIYKVEKNFCQCYTISNYYYQMNC